MEKKKRTRIKAVALILCFIIGVGLAIWGAFIMRNHDGYLEVMKAARNAALPQLLGGIGVLCIAYVLTFSKDFWK